MHSFEVSLIELEKFNYIKFWYDLNIIIRIECILLKFHWGIKALIELHFQHEALPKMLYFTVFLLVRSNTRDIPFSNILISKKQFLCNKIPYCTLVQNQ
jgi:hypothetical protein